MQQPTKKMDIHIQLGQQDGLQFLTDVTGTITSNPTLVQNILAQSKFNQDPGNDTLLVFHFYLQQGKEKQAVAYFQQALSETIQDEEMSPIQKPLRRPSQKGVVDVVQTPGCIIIKYRFFATQMNDQEDLSALQAEFDKYEKATFQFNASLKGYLKHNNKNRTNVKVDYVDLRLSSDELSPSDFTKILNSISLQQEELEFMTQIPAVQMLGNLKSANFDLKMASFRQIKSFYSKACQDKFEKQDKPFPYVNRGLFRKQISAFGFFKNKIGIKFDANYNGEDVLMRLIKVYETFFDKVLGL